MSKILVVDDDQGITRLLEHMLTRQGHQVLTASNGMAGLQIASQEAPDLVVLDIMLPGLDGFEVCHRLRNRPATAQIPVLMLSAKGQAADRKAALQVGADEYIVKPIDRPQFLATAERLLARKQAESQPQGSIVAFIGARGGVGTSTVVANLSVILAQKGHPPVLVDLCPSFGGMSALLGLKPEHTIADLFKAPADKLNRNDIEAVLTEHSTGVRLLSEGQTPEGRAALTPAGIEVLLRELATMSEHVLLDLPASPTEVVRAVLKKCDLVNLVTEPESLARVGASLALFSRLGVDRKRLGLVIVDRSGRGPPMDPSALTSIDGTPVMGIIPFAGEEFRNAEERGTPIVLAGTHSPASLAFGELAEQILRLEVLAHTG